MKERDTNSKQAFSLLETLLYITLVGGFVYFISLTLTTIYKTQSKSQAISEVSYVGVQHHDIIGDILDQSASITSPTPGNSANTLIVNQNSGDAITITTSGNKLTIQVNGDPAQTVTSDQATISNLLFTNLSNVNTSGNVSYSYTVSYSSQSNLQEFNFNQDFYGGYSLK